MATMTVEKLEKRLVALERQSRWVKGFSVLVLAVVGVALLMGAKGPDRIVEAEKFVLKDSNGTARATLQMQTSGPSLGPSLCLLDETGKVRLALGAYENHEVIGVYDKRGICRTCLSALEDRVVLSLCDETSKTRAFLAASNRSAEFSLRDETGKSSLLLAVDKDSQVISLGLGTGKSVRLENGQDNNQPCILLRGPGHERASYASLCVFRDGGDLSLSGVAEKPRVSLGVVYNIPHVQLSDNGGVDRLDLRIDKDGPVISLRDEARRVRARLGVFVGRPESHLYNAAGLPIWSAP
jgi:hypothetical protein